ncbi:MAG: lamin tail domain-containing protein [Candidatus Latescibacterota bacterium]|nr:MAG: lamin tail domain-containing protein [Candidatus Latescibacterota bacterium]
MSRLLRSLIVAASVCSGVTSILAAPACHGQVRINEILADPASDWNGDAATHFRDDEWIEIVNAGPGSVSLDSLRLSDASNAFRYGFSGTLSSGDHRIVYGSDSVAWESEHGESSVGLSLNNGGDSVRLWQISGAETLLVDEYTYVSHEVVDDRSTARVPDGGDTWLLFDALNPYSGETPPLGSGCPPTPAESNACPTAVESTSWTTLKRLFETP